MSGSPSHVIAAIPQVVEQNLGWLVAAVVVVLGLLVYGFRDLLRFSPTRVWAISSVNFAESIRRKVLWIIPLAILGVIMVTQFQKAVDPQDAIRQTIKFSLFATGMLVVIATIILACTNLPREIENRVIYTVVTKPTTRLELVLGKVVGFARISATILLIMGLFTWGYLQFRAHNFRNEIVAELESGRINELEKNTLAHYAEPGALLAARELVEPQRTDFYARMPAADDERRWMVPMEQEILVPFLVTAADLTPPGSPVPGPEGVEIVLEGLGYEKMSPQAPRKNSPDQDPPPHVTVSIADANRNSLISYRSLTGGFKQLPPPGSTEPQQVTIPADSVASLYNAADPDRPNLFYVVIQGVSRDVIFSAGDRPAHLRVSSGPGPAKIIEPVPGPDGEVAPPLFRSRMGRYGPSVPGDPSGDGILALLQYRGVELGQQSGGAVPFELRAGIERSGDETRVDNEFTRLRVQVRNPQTGDLSEPVEVTTENNRPTFFTLPGQSLPESGDFDLVVRTLTEGHFVGIRSDSLRVVTGIQGFAPNLFKSLFILWLLTLLVIVVSIFCSTFVSWPIAIVLTSLILLGHWGVEQLGDTTRPGIGNLVATQLGLEDASANRVVSETVERLTRFLNVVSAVLPDISKFSAVEDIEEGITIPPPRMAEALQVLAAFGLPLTVLAYVFLRNKEVAP